MRHVPVTAHRTSQTRMVLVALIGGLLVFHGTIFVIVTLGMFSHRATENNEAEMLELAAFNLSKHGNAAGKCATAPSRRCGSVAAVTP